MSRFRGISARISQWIVRAAPVGYEEFYVLLERGLFNPAPVEHTHIFDGTERWAAAGINRAPESGYHRWNIQRDLDGCRSSVIEERRSTEGRSQRGGCETKSVTRSEPGETKTVTKETCGGGS
jgi:hypothetical protein